MEEKKPKRQAAATKKTTAAPKRTTSDSAAKASTPSDKPAAGKLQKPDLGESKKMTSPSHKSRTRTPRPAAKPKKAKNSSPFWAPFAKPEAPKPEPEWEEKPKRFSSPRPSQERPRPTQERPSPAETSERKRFTKRLPADHQSAPPRSAKPIQLTEPMRLNKFLAHCGVAARRQSAEFVKKGLVTVNGTVEPNPSYPVQLGDEVRYKGEVVRLEERKVYILMNKPKDVITTANDEKGRKTVLDLIGRKVEERIFPVGRLDRMTTGLLLLTNDGELAEKLAHPSHKVQKVYHVTLNRPFQKNDFEKVRKGLKLEDGIAQVDSLHYVEEGKDELEIGLHIGKNRIVRRIFEYLGYEVIKLDRTYYAGLTKKDIGRGHFRHLTEQEVIMLKHFK